MGELGYIDLGAVPHGDQAAGAIARELSEDLRNAGFRSDVVGDILAWKRRKLLANLINALDALCGPSAWGSDLGAMVVAEGEAVFRAAGLAVVSEDEMRGRRAPEIATQVPVGAPPIASSTTQSVGRGARGIETFHLNGMILSLGRVHGVATPANALVQSEVISLIRSAGPLGAQDPDELLARLPR